MEIVLGRVGHYFDAGNGACQTALVTAAFSSETVPDAGAVNLAVWNHGATQTARASVPVDAAPTTEAKANSFHLTRDCPWGR